jgi:hypothetical protein
MKLTAHQKRILRFAKFSLAHGHGQAPVRAGRNGWNVNHVEKLAELGLVALVHKGYYSSDWNLTELGRKAAFEAYAEHHKELNGMDHSCELCQEATR